MKTSLKDKLLHKIQTEGTVTYGAMCQFVAELGYRIPTAERRLRELMEDNAVFALRKRSKRNTEYISAYTANPQQRAVLPQITIRVIDGRPVAVMN